MAAAIKKTVSVPVIAVGRLDAELGNRIINDGKADFIAINRRIIADSEYPNKIGAGKKEDIAPCTGCMTCFDHCERGLEPRCRINAALGKEKEFAIQPAVNKKKVLIVGGGPAGMEAARVAALRGHNLGGSLLNASVIKGFNREDLQLIARYLQTQIAKLGVKVVVGKTADLSTFQQLKPDVVIIATGGKHNTPSIKGINNQLVLTSEELHGRLKRYLRILSPRMIDKLTHIWMPIGKKVVIIGGNIQGCQTAEFLVKRGRQVAIVETGKKIGEGLLDILIKPSLLLWLTQKGVKIYTSAKYKEITEQGLTILTRDGKKIKLEADNIITALPLQADDSLNSTAKENVKEVYLIGDSREPGMIVDAISGGFQVGNTI
jgi:2,4-dienoyl-CoA reductase (NADPH2)